MDKTCYVCHKGINKKDEIHIGKGIYRHDRCHPGSVRWIRSETGKKSKLREFFMIPTQKEER